MSPELQTIIETYNELPTEVQQEIFYGSLQETCKALGYIHDLSGDQVLFLENEVALIILGICKRKDLESRLVEQIEIPTESAISIIETIDMQILEPLALKLSKYLLKQNPDTSKEGAAEQYIAEQVFSEPSTIPYTTETHVQSVEPSSVPEVRTMASDMRRSTARPEYEPVVNNEETTYVSTQPEIRKNLSDTPSYNAPLYQAPKPSADAPLEKPRWGS